jgi:hypothetical protein
MNWRCHECVQCIFRHGAARRSDPAFRLLQRWLFRATFTRAVLTENRRRQLELPEFESSPITLSTGAGAAPAVLVERVSLSCSIRKAFLKQ